MLSQLAKTVADGGEQTGRAVGDGVASIINADPPCDQRLFGRAGNDVRSIRCPLVDLVCDVDGERVVQR